MRHELSIQPRHRQKIPPGSFFSSSRECAQKVTADWLTKRAKFVPPVSLCRNGTTSSVRGQITTWSTAVNVTQDGQKEGGTARILTPASSPSAQPSWASRTIASTTPSSVEAVSQPQPEGFEWHPWVPVDLATYRGRSSRPQYLNRRRKSRHERNRIFSPDHFITVSQSKILYYKVMLCQSFFYTPILCGNSFDSAV